MTRTYRKGGVGAMMDEYERAASELKTIIEPLTEREFERVLDPDTQDASCRSVQTIISHVVGAGYLYAHYVRLAFGIESSEKERKLLDHANALAELDRMLEDTASALEGKWLISDDEMADLVIESRWNMTYNLEQLLEHAIVHILRHRRQIERLLSQNQAPAAV